MRGRRPPRGGGGRASQGAPFLTPPKRPGECTSVRNSGRRISRPRLVYNAVSWVARPEAPKGWPGRPGICAWAAAPPPAPTPAQVVPGLPPGSVPAFRCRPDQVPTELTAREEEGRARGHPLLTLAGGARGPPHAPEARLRESRPCTAKFA